MGVLLTTCSAWAQAMELFDWQAPPHCPDQGQAQEVVTNWLAMSPQPLNPQSLRIVARVRPEKGGYWLTLDLQSASGHDNQSLFAVRCETLVEVVALRAALAADPVALIERMDAKATQDISEAPPERASSTRHPPKSLVQLRVGGDLLLGLLPDASGGLSIHGGLQFSEWRVELGARYAWPRELRYATPAGVGAEVQLAIVSGRGCLTPTFRRVQVMTCLGIDGGMMQGRGFGIEAARTSRQPWFAAVVGPSIRVPKDTRVGAILGVDALLQLLDVHFQVRHLPRLFVSDRTAFRASLGIEVQL